MEHCQKTVVMSDSSSLENTMCDEQGRPSALRLCQVTFMTPAEYKDTSSLRAEKDQEISEAYFAAVTGGHLQNIVREIENVPSGESIHGINVANMWIDRDQWNHLYSEMRDKLECPSGEDWCPPGLTAEAAATPAADAEQNGEENEGEENETDPENETDQENS